MSSNALTIENLLSDPSLKQHVARWLSDPSEADDVVQLVAEKLICERIPVLTRGYLYAVLKNSAIDLRRADVRRERNEAALLPQAEGTLATSPERALQATRASAAVQAVLDAQPPLNREIFRLYHVQHMTQPEIASLLDLHLSTVEKRLAKVRAACLSELKAHLD